MKWNVFSLEAIKVALRPKFALEQVRYVTDDEEYGEGESTRFVFRNVEDMPEIDYIKRTISTFIRDTYVYFKDKSIKPMRLWQDNLNESESHIRYSTNHLISPALELIGETYISDERYFHKWMMAQGWSEFMDAASITIDVDVIYAYDNVDKVGRVPKTAKCMAFVLIAQCICVNQKLSRLLSLSKTKSSAIAY